MTQEEKAKRYDKAIKRGLDYIRQTPATEMVTRQSILEHIFPELKESEDERIRKKIIQLVNDAMATNAPYKKEMLAWLEKQCEQKPIISNNALREGITHFGITQYQIDNWLKKYVDVEKQGEQESEEFDDTNAKRMFIKALERVEEQNAKGYKLTDCDKNSWWEDFKAYTSCIVEQKPWSEEDESMLNQTLFYLEAYKNGCSGLPVLYMNKCISWLKFLKGRYTWKPSDEQMERLKGAINSLPHQEVLYSLYQDLKKLRGE